MYYNTIIIIISFYFHTHTHTHTHTVPATVESLVGFSIFRQPGGTVLFQFNISEDSPPVRTENIRWFFISLNNRVDITDTTDERFNISSDRLSLIIDGVTHTDEGEYLLQATNEAGPGIGVIVLSIAGMYIYIYIDRFVMS